jgi:excinuclease ABC subunit B
MIFVSATPGPYEKQVSTQIVEQVIRPTGLVDPKITVLPVTPGHAATSIVDRGSTETDDAGVMISTHRDPNYKGQVEDLIGRIITHVADKERVLVTTLTKKMAEDLTDFLTEKKIKVQYLHSDVVTLDRIKIITEFRRGKYDVLVGVNLLREGLDLPEVTLVAILDADKEGFLRSETSLIQTIGRAARNVKGEVILYADEITPSMSRAMKETERRRAKQLAYNAEHNITPRTIQKVIKDIMEGLTKDEDRVKNILALENKAETHDIKELLKDKEAQMREAAKNLEFELAALLRDEIALLSKQAKKSTVPKKIKKER